ncbi:MAG: prenyltransferase [Candidatus Thermoplasmatota archaeon]|nr:prenyltransferase [Candidatus Thermoplasmatota archaeon]
MFDNLKYAFKVSRFRFWIYTGGTFVIGYTLGAERISDFYSLDYYIYLFYFFFLANVFIYGVNDLFDLSTDKENPKKEEKEHKLVRAKIRDLKVIIYVTTIISLILLFFQNNWIERAVFSSFLFLSYFYSANPLRFKSKPVVDFSSNMLYIMPGIFAYILISSEFPPLLIILAGFFHISAMHIFSAVPDIKYDKKAGIKTTAVVLGEKPSLMLSLGFWSVFASITIFLTGYHPLSLLILIYPMIPLFILKYEKAKIKKIYWFLPYVNISLGGILFIVLIFETIL